MRRFQIMAALAAVMLSLCGCDFLRSVAGRPTSDQLAARQQAVIEAEARAQEEIARANAIARHTADSAAAVQSILQSGLQIITMDKLQGLEEVHFSYFIALGSFSQEENALAFLRKVKDAGYEAVLLKYRSGRSLLSVCPTDDPVELDACLSKIRQEVFCPADAWIFMNKPL